MEIKLHPNGWHRRLQKYVFGDHLPVFHNFCPYFWITNFCILVTFIIPVIPFIKLIMLICGGLSWGFNKAADYFEESICKPMFERSSLKMTGEELLSSWFFHDYHDVQYKEWDQMKYDSLNAWEQTFRTKDYDWYETSTKKRQKKIKKFEIWKTKTPNWEQILADYQAKKKADHVQHLKNLADKREERIAQEIKDREHQESREKRKQWMIQFIIKYTKWIIYPILITLAGFILYWLYKGISAIVIYTIAHFYWDRFVTVMQYAGVILGSAAVVFGFFYLLVKIFSRITCSFCFSLKGTWFCKAMTSVGDGIVWFVLGIGTFFSFFWNGIMIFKSNYCPGIEWDKEKD